MEGKFCGISPTREQEHLDGEAKTNNAMEIVLNFVHHKVNADFAQLLCSYSEREKIYSIVRDTNCIT